MTSVGIETRPRRATRSPAPPWASGVVTGMEAAVLSAGLVYAFAFAVAAAAPSIDGSISVDWTGAWDVGTAVWLLAHGVPATAGGVTVALVPLGLTWVAGAIAASVARRVAIPAHASVMCAALAYGAIVAVVAAHDGTPFGLAVRAGAVGAAVCGTGTTMGLSRAHGFRFWAGVRLPGAVGKGVRLGVAASAMCLAAGAAVAVAWQATAVSQTSAVAADLSPDLAGGLALAAGETAYVPTVSAWGLSWLSGLGFDVGTGTHYAPAGVTPGPVPEIPLFAALPAGSGGLLLGAPIVLVAIGGAARVRARRWLGTGGGQAVAILVAVAVVAAVSWLASLAASGSGGGGVLTHVGPPAGLVGLSVAGLVGAGMVLAAAGTAARAATEARASSRATAQRSPGVPPSSPSAPSRTPPNNDPLQLW